MKSKNDDSNTLELFEESDEPIESPEPEPVESTPESSDEPDEPTELLPEPDGSTDEKTDGGLYETILKCLIHHQK